MTSGERMVWAAEFVRAMTGMSQDDPGIVAHAARRAAQAVDAMRQVADSHEIDAPARAMVTDMLGNGADR